MSAAPRPTAPAASLVLLSASLSGLAAGGLWALASLVSGRPLELLALPLAWLLAWIGRAWSLRAHWQRGLLVVLAWLLALLFRLGLLSTLSLAGSLGLAPLEALHTGGAGLLLSLIRLRLDPLHGLYYAAVIALALLSGRSRS